MSKDKQGNIKDKLNGNELDLSLSQLTAVPVKEIAAIPKATHIDLSCNLLPALALDFCTLVNIIKLDLSKNRLESLPDAFGDLQRLQSLDLYSNRLKTVPVSCFRLKNLKWLDLRDNPLCEELRSVAGDCLNETECKNCAKRVVAYMRNVQADQERTRQKRLQEEREIEALRKVEEEEERQRRKAEKLKEKERKRREYAERKALEEEKAVEEPTTTETVEKTAPVSNGSTQKTTEKPETVGLSCLGALLASFVGLLCILAFSLYYCETHPKDALCMQVRKTMLPYYSPIKAWMGRYINLSSR